MSIRIGCVAERVPRRTPHVARAFRAEGYAMWETFVTATTVEQALGLLREHGQDARIINGGTDLIIEIERRMRSPKVVIDVSRIGELDGIRLENGVFHLGAGVTHNQAAAHNEVVERAFPLASACWHVGAPQIRNRGTIAGNLITASPANDTAAPLAAMGAQVTVQSRRRGTREVALEDFVLGIRRTALEPDEMVTGISFPALKGNQVGTFVKLGLRWGQAISVVNVAVILGFRSPSRQSQIESARIALGSVAPTIVSAEEAQHFLVGKTLDHRFIAEAAGLAMQAARPIDDIRGSAEYRREMLGVLVGRALASLRDGTERDDFPSERVMLWGKTGGRAPVRDLEQAGSSQPIETTVNGKEYSVDQASGKTLLGMLREDIGLMGTKEGCAEGRCGACTVFLDGMAVMACLVPAARAHHATVVTIEGLQRGEELHPVQAAFIEAGAVQCGYCSPGFIMSGVKLLEEVGHPTREEIRQALSGNLCRCTGYSRILQAIELAARSEGGR
jgi:xanthine dehydrogenase iron-sulfur cluster and FAD-binding subunit A